MGKGMYFHRVISNLIMPYHQILCWAPVVLNAKYARKVVPSHSYFVSHGTLVRCIPFFFPDIFQTIGARL